jgi:multiple antibiotic resistance protein
MPLNEAINIFLLVYASLFPIVNPVGGAPIFYSMTRHCSDRERHTLARKVAVNGFLLLLGSLFVGSHVLEFFGITLPVVSIAGGLVVSAYAWRLLHASAERIEPNTTRPSGTPLLGPVDSFYPLTLPLTVGPGSISVAITLGSQRPTDSVAYPQLLLLGAAATAGLLAIAFTIYVCYRFAEWIRATLGDSGTNVLVRLTAFFLLCIGIQIVWNGYKGLGGLAG